MNLNRLHRIFNSRRGLSREDIKCYGKTNDPELKNQIEQNSMSSSFDQDAIEGWGDLSYDTSALKNLDKKFVVGNNAAWYWVGGLAVTALIIVIAIVVNPFNTKDPMVASNHIEENSTTLSEDQEITIEESDIYIPEPIEEMNEIPIIEQVQPKEIKADFAEIKLIIDAKVEVKELTPVDVIDENLNIVSNRKLAKEIYLNDLKLIDYRQYRTKPKVTTKQIILTGTPANKEVKTQVT